MKYCENCGAFIEEGTSAAFCEQCGAAIDSSENTTREVVEKEHEPAIKAPVVESIPIVEQEDVKTVQDQEIPPHPRKIKWALPVIGFFILIALIGGYWWSNRPNETAEVSTITSSSQELPEIQPSTTATSTEVSSESSNSEEKKVEDNFPIIIGQLSDETVGQMVGKKGIYVASINEKSEPYMENGSTAIRSASIIKLFLMEAFYSQVQEGGMRLNEPYVLKEYDKVGGTGVIQNMAEGSVLTYEELVRHMIIDSDNTAGNILLTILGGPSLVTKFIHEQGYSNTRVERQFLDTTALSNGLDNYTSAEDLGKLLTTIYQQQSVSPVYDQQMLAILKENKNQTKLPANIGSEVVVFNKTGEYSDYGVQNDACIFEKDKSVFVVVMLAQDGNEAEQVSAMNQFGLAIYEKYLKGE